MNILVLSWRDTKHPLAGGAEQVMHEHMKGWIAVGHEVTFFSSAMKGLASAETIDGVKIIRKGFQYIGVQIAAFFWYLFSKHEDFDLVVDEFHGLPFFTPLYARKPILAVIQEVTREVWLLNPLKFPLNIIVGFLGYFFEPLIFIPYRNTHFMTGSDSAKAELVKMGIDRSKVHVVNHGVIVKKPTKTYKTSVPAILYLGRLSKDKGIEDALKTFEILNRKIDCKFWIFGKPETEAYGKQLLEKIENSDARNKIKIWPYVDGKWKYLSDAEKYRVVAGATVMINPSYREGWGLVNIEANFLGVPVVAYPSAGLVDSVKNGVSGILTKRKKPEDLANGAFRLLTDGSFLKKLQKGAISWSKNFTWDKSVSRSLTLIEDVAKLN